MQDAAEPHSNIATEMDVATATPILERTPGVLRALLAGLPERWLTHDEGPGTWSPTQIIIHLIAAERAAWIPRIRHVLEFGGERTLPVFDRTGGFDELANRPIVELLDQFAGLRADSLSVLSGLGLSAETLAREGSHPEFGPVLLRQLLATWVVHDLAHTAQIVRVMAKQQRDAVGPWVNYLRILR